MTWAGTCQLPPPNFLFPLFDVAVILKFSQGHQNWYGIVKLYDGYYPAKFKT